MIQLHPPTQGASIGYRFAGDPAGRWQLYINPFVLSPGTHDLSAKAIRIGFKESPEVRFLLKIGTAR